MKFNIGKNDFDLTKYETKKNQIFNAVLKCIYEHGISALTMRQIAKEAKINLGTIHYYFKSKETLLVEFIQVLLK